MTSRRLTPLRAGAAFFGIAAAGLCLAALLTTQWYHMTEGATEVHLGVYNGCTNGSCDTIDFAGVGTTLASGSTCLKSADDAKTRNNAVFGLTIAGGALGLLTCISVLVSSTRRGCGFAAVMFSILAFGALTAADVLFPFLWHKWYFCESPLCDYAAPAAAGSCESFFGYSYAFVVVAAACMIVSVILTIGNASRGLPPASKAEPSAQRAAPSQQPSTSSVVVDESSQQDAASVTRQRHIIEHPVPPSERNVDDRHHHVPEQPPADQRSPIAENRRTSEMRALTTTTTNNQSLDGWELDPNTGLYWSDSEKLFYDPVSGHFYDPESELWYDPTTEQWYQGAEQ